MARKIMIAILAVFLLPFSFMNLAEAKQQVITATGTYQMGESDTMVSAKEAARKDALRMAAEKAGVYVKSYSKTNNLALTNDEVETLAVRILKVNQCTYTQEYQDNTLIFHANIEAVFDDDDFKELISKEKQVSSLQNQLEEEKEKNKDIKNMVIQRTGEDFSTSATLVRCENEIKKNRNFNAITVLNSMIKEREGIAPARAYYLRSVANFNLKHYDEAVADANKAMEIEPHNPLYYVHKGFCELQESDYYEAEALGDTAQSFDKRYWPAMYLRSAAKAFRGSTHKAMDDCEDAMKRGGHGVSFFEYFKAQLQMQYNGRHRDVRISYADEGKIIHDSINGLMSLPTKKKR